jgi:nitroreductase
MEVWEAIQNKRAIRLYADRALPDDTVERILQAGRRAQSAHNWQAWDFIVVHDRDRLKGLSLTGNITFVAEAALCVVIATPLESEHMDWIIFDAGQCAAYMQLTALEQGVVSCLGAVLRQDDARKILKYPEDKTATMLIAFGYPGESDGPSRRRGRKSLDEIVHEETW